MLRNKSMVVGSTGLVGKSVVNHLIEKDIAVLALVRNDEVSKNSLLNYFKIDFDDLQFPDETFSDIKDIFICLGTTIKKAGSKEAFQKVDITYCYEIAKQAQARGVKNISIVTSLGSDSNSANFYLKSKGMIEDKITNIDFDSISIHRPGLLIGARNEMRLGEFIGQKIFPYFIDPFLMGSLRKYRSIKGDTLAKAMVNLSGCEEGVNYYYFDDFNESAKGNS
tara:strand:- start:261 stop:929 length:669 start_codon:yes stop_codon:yes gene_type:complete